MTPDLAVPTSSSAPLDVKDANKPKRNTPISRAELTRRWAAVRAEMRSEGVDVLVMQNNMDSYGGYVRYFTDTIPGVQGTSLIFPIDDDMTIVRPGAFGGDRDLSQHQDGQLPGVKRVMTVPVFSSCWYTGEYNAELIAAALTPYAEQTIGLVGTAQMLAPFLERLRRELPNATLIEASDVVDRVMVIKSEEEKERIRDSAALLDATMQHIFEVIAPGVLERTVTAAAHAFAIEHGSDHGKCSLGSTQPGTPAHRNLLQNQDKAIQKGDVISILVEYSGPGGYYTELGRVCTLGKAPPELVDELEVTRAAQRMCLGLMKPGAASAEIWEQYNEFLRQHGRPEEKRLHCHGQGYNLVERPLIRFDEPMKVAKDMNFACHPTYAYNNVYSWICDNYLIGDDGPGDSLHALPQQIFEL